MGANPHPDQWFREIAFEKHGSSACPRARSVMRRVSRAATAASEFRVGVLRGRMDVMPARAAKISGPVTADKHVRMRGFFSIQDWLVRIWFLTREMGFNPESAK